jgi:hypothetical protein
MHSGGEHCLNDGSYSRGVCCSYPFHLGKDRPLVNLIRRYCLWRQVDTPDLEKDCGEGTEHLGQPACQLRPSRMARNPKRAGVGGKFAENHTVSRVWTSWIRRNAIRVVNSMDRPKCGKAVFSNHS